MHRLDLGVRLEAVGAELAPDPALLEPPKRHTGMEQGVLVLPHRTGVERRGDPRSLTRVVGEHRGGETVGGRVGQLEGFFLGLELGSDDDGAEDLERQGAEEMGHNAKVRSVEA
jgi:hypothetical protein